MMQSFSCFNDDVLKLNLSLKEQNMLLLVKRASIQKIILANLQTTYYISCRRNSSRSPQNLLEHLNQRIKATGPITVASYMKEALTNPLFGYYMKGDVFGKKGDFTTSPEISQVFGELVAVWLMMQWDLMNKPSPVQLVELGPGRGTLMTDILRVFDQFTNVQQNFTVHFVEVSAEMRKIQEKKFKEISENNLHQTKVYWYDRIQDVPQGLSFFIAHEFFDALPVHLFRKIDDEWRELLVNSDQSTGLHFVNAPGPSPIGEAFLNNQMGVSECEICPEASVIMSHVTNTIVEFDGCALIIDYGEEESDRHSIRGFKQHELVKNVLREPGKMDLTAMWILDFLKRHSHPNSRCYGPITQQSFLLQMGIRERLQALLRNSTMEQGKNLISSCNYLVSSKQMGEKFKVMAVTNRDNPPICFPLK